MSDTTAYLAGCATTGVAALVLLVARVGMVSANTEADRASQLGERLDRIEATATDQRATDNTNTQTNQQQLEYEIRRELDKQRDLTQRLEDQLAEQESLSGNLEEQLQEQEEKTKELLTKIQSYQRSVEDMELEDKIAAATRPATEPQPTPAGPPASLIWLGASVAAVLLLGGAGLLLCAGILVLQFHRRSSRPVMPPPMPMPPASPYRYYDQTFLPPPQLRPRRPTYYDYPPSPYDYNP